MIAEVFRVTFVIRGAFCMKNVCCRDTVLIGTAINVSTWMHTSTHIHYITWVLGGNHFSHPSHLVHLGHSNYPRHFVHFLIYIKSSPLALIPICVSCLTNNTRSCIYRTTIRLTSDVNIFPYSLQLFSTLVMSCLYLMFD